GPIRAKAYAVAEDIAVAVAIGGDWGPGRDGTGWAGLDVDKGDVIICRNGTSKWYESRRSHPDPLPALSFTSPIDLAAAAVLDGGATLVLVDEPLAAQPQIPVVQGVAPASPQAALRQVAELLKCCVLAVVDPDETEALFAADVAIKVKPDRGPFAGRVDVVKGGVGRFLYTMSDCSDVCPCSGGKPCETCRTVANVWPAEPTHAEETGRVA
ncbi:MAG: hypothetical protein ACREPS_07495, partial [Rhodanobacteraceae bacterium]